MNDHTISMTGTGIWHNQPTSTLISVTVIGDIPCCGDLHGMFSVWRTRHEQVDYEYTSEDQARGLAKLVEAAVGYDATGPACLGLGAFQVRGECRR